MFDFITKKRWYFLLSALVIIPGIVSLIVSGLNVGVEFSSGSTMTLVFREPVTEETIRAALADLNHPEAVVQHSAKDAFLLEGEVLTSREKDELIEALQPDFGALRMADLSSATEGAIALIFDKKVFQGELRQKLDVLGYSEADIQSKTLNSFLVRTKTLATEERDSEGKIVPSEERQIKKALEQEFGLGPVASLDFYSISPIVAAERVRATGYAVIAAAVGILIYITWVFRRLVHSVRYGVSAIIALIHDALIVLGMFSLFRIEVNSIFIIAVLTVIGYSVNNTIVVFDRIRENRARYISSDFVSTVNLSLSQTLTRSLNTSLTTLFALLAIYLFGGTTISNFALALMIGIVAGTYSSIFIASQLVVSWEQGELGWIFRWIPLRRLAARIRR